jgi:hypothetical protein
MLSLDKPVGRLNCRREPSNLLGSLKAILGAAPQTLNAPNPVDNFEYRARPAAASRSAAFPGINRVHPLFGDVLKGVFGAGNGGHAAIPAVGCVAPAAC